jgi:hypothetical protein
MPVLYFERQREVADPCVLKNVAMRFMIRGKPRYADITEMITSCKCTTFPYTLLSKSFNLFMFKFWQLAECIHPLHTVARDMQVIKLRLVLPDPITEMIRDKKTFR